MAEGTIYCPLCRHNIPASQPCIKASDAYATLMRCPRCHAYQPVLKCVKNTCTNTGLSSCNDCVRAFTDVDARMLTRTREMVLGLHQSMNHQFAELERKMEERFAQLEARLMGQIARLPPVMGSEYATAKESFENHKGSP